MQITTHEFPGGASVWYEDGDKAWSTGILKPGKHDYGIATRTEYIVVTRGKGKINGTKVKYNANGDDEEVSVTHIVRGERILITVEGDEMGYMCDYGPKIFHEIFSRPVETLGLDAETLNFVHEHLRVNTVGELSKASGKALMLSNDFQHGRIHRALESVGLRCHMSEDDMLAWTVEQEKKAIKS